MKKLDEPPEEVLSFTMTSPPEVGLVMERSLVDCKKHFPRVPI